jgi:hypothetical protein
VNAVLSSSNLPPRGLSRIEAAAYARLSPSRFSAARRDGKYPHATLPGGRYDRTLLDQAMDRLSGIAAIEGACASCGQSGRFGDI